MTVDKNEFADVLTVEDTAILALSMMQDGDVPEATIERFVLWAEGVRIENALLDLALRGMMKVKWDDEQKDWLWADRKSVV